MVYGIKPKKNIQEEIVEEEIVETKKSEVMLNLPDVKGNTLNKEHPSLKVE